MPDQIQAAIPPSTTNRAPMYATTVVLDVRCDAQHAFDHIARGFFQNHSRWDPAVLEMIRDDDGPVGLGTTGREVRKVPGSRVVSAVRVTTFEPDRRFAFRTTSGPMLEAVDWTVEATAAGSRVTMALAFTPLTMPMRIMAPLLRRQIPRNVRANAERLRAALDSEV
jgi:Polyketide cyclase / dehydrase and lipid transport